MSVLQGNTVNAKPVKYEWYDSDWHYLEETACNYITVSNVTERLEYYCDITYDNGYVQEGCWTSIAPTLGLSVEDKSESYYIPSTGNEKVEVEVQATCPFDGDGSCTYSYAWSWPNGTSISTTTRNCFVSASDVIDHLDGDWTNIICKVTASYNGVSETNEHWIGIQSKGRSNNLFYEMVNNCKVIQKLGSTFTFDVDNDSGNTCDVILEKEYPKGTIDISTTTQDTTSQRDTYSYTPTEAGAYAVNYGYDTDDDRTCIWNEFFAYDADNATNLTLNTVNNINAMESGAIYTYKFTPTKTGYYTFSTAASDICIDVVDSNDWKVRCVHGASDERFAFGAGKTYYFIVSYDGETNDTWKATCNFTLTACDHFYTLTGATEAGCGSTGYTGTVKCKNCGLVMDAGRSISATGNHITTEIRNTKEATCGTTGYTGDKYCKDCGQKIESGTEIPATGNHVWDEGKVTKEATAKEEGEKTYTCSVCNATKTEAIAKIDSSTPVSDVNDAVEGQQVETTDTKASYVATGDGTVTYQAPTSSKSKKVKVPDTVTDASGNTVKVTAVADEAFKGNSKVTDVSLGKNITSVGDKAFANCKNLKQVSLGSKVTEIGKNAFKGDNKLKKITISSKNIKASGISKGAFSGVTSKTTIDVPNKKAAAYKKIFQKKGLNKKVKVK